MVLCNEKDDAHVGEKYYRDGVAVEQVPPDDAAQRDRQAPHGAQHRYGAVDPKLS